MLNKIGGAAKLISTVAVPAAGSSTPAWQAGLAPSMHTLRSRVSGWPGHCGLSPFSVPFWCAGEETGFRDLAKALMRGRAPGL